MNIVASETIFSRCFSHFFLLLFFILRQKKTIDFFLGMIYNKHRKDLIVLVQVAAALIWQENRFLICQRPAHKARGLLWEFVGGKQEPGESLPETLIRECKEELDITVEVRELYFRVIHKYPDIEIRLSLYHCGIASGEIRLLEHNDAKWISVSQIDDYAFCPADEEILKKLKQDFSSIQ